ncbi:MAG TPA: HEAT repeat domain-containing protein, partial [Planctomycetota bacterium]|nr:HEAT repeat domain-containing protein [Planctomycetota bacterium]
EIIKTNDVDKFSHALQADERSALHALHAMSAIAQTMGTELSAKFGAFLKATAAGNPMMTDDLRRARAAVSAEFRDLAKPHDDHDWNAEDIRILESASDLRAQQDAMLRLVKSAGEWCADADSRKKVWKAAGLSPIAKHYWRLLASSSMTPAQFAAFFDDGEAQAIELLDAVEGVALRMAETRRGALEEHPRGPFEDLEAILALARGEGAGANARVRVKALHALGILERVCEPWDGKWWSIAPAKTSHPARTLDWRGTASVKSTLEFALAFPDDSTRKAALAAVVDTADERFAPALRERVLREQEHELHLAAIQALGKVGSAEDGDLFARVARKSQDLAERLEALRIGARLAPERILETALFLAEREGTPAKLQALALEVIAESDPSQWADAPAIFELAAKRSRDSWPEVRCASCKLIALMERESALPLLLELNRDPEVHRTAFDVLANLGDPRAARVFALGLADPEPEVRSAARRVIARSRKELRPALEGMVQRQEFPGAVVRELRGLYAGHQPILAWTIRGPCDLEAPEGKLDFSKEHADLSLASLKTFEPRLAVSSRADGMIDLRALLGEKSNQATYAFADFESASERDVELRVGSDDQVTVWLDGERVHAFDGARGFTAEADAFHARVRAGRNALVLRIGQVSGDWSFALTVPEEGSGPLFETTLPARPTVAEYRAFALEHAGDAAKGKAVLDDVQRTTCLRCHSLGPVGEHVGPDLAGLGARSSRSEIADSILSPSKRILDGYAAVSVLTKDDQLLFGQIKQDDARGIVLIDTTGTPIEIARDNVSEVRSSKLSVMPEGLCNTLTPAEFADLLAYLSKK